MKYQKIVLKQNENKVESSTKNKLLDELLALRNICSKVKIESFLNPSKKDLISPYAFKDMQKAKTRILEAIEKKENILVWGDFDCDGVTSSAIVYKALKKLGANVEVFIPNRITHGHGLNNKELIKQVSKNKIKLVITVDCGVSNVKEVALLKSFKVDTIITDHHSLDGDLPDACCIINPNVNQALKDDLTMDEITSLSCNSGSHVAYKLAIALLEDIEDDILKTELLIIAATGVIADVVPLIGENRALVTIALELLNTKKENSMRAIFTLLDKNVQNRNFTSTDIAFILAPRINAVGRLSDASISFEFLTTESLSKIDFLIEQLNDYNTIRQAKCEQIYDDILNSIDKKEKKNPAIILYNPDWHIGIIGIAASKVVENYLKPCFLMTKDDNNIARCSIRSNSTINVYNVLKENASLFEGFGGHELAGGLSFDLAKTSFEAVKSALLKTVDELKEDNATENTFLADIELDKDDINFDLIETIDKLEPFGQGNEQPIFYMKDVKLVDYKTIGKENNHLKMTFSKGDMKFDCIKWHDRELKIPIDSITDIAFFPRVNEFNGNKTIQFEIYDIYSADYVEKDSENIQETSPFKLFDHRRKEGILSMVNDYLKNLKGSFGVWAKTPKTKESLADYEGIKENIITNEEAKKGLMFFDYPSSKEEFYDILTNIKPDKIHFMNTSIDENLENYIKQLIGMIKYCANKMDGKIVLEKLSLALGLNNNFTSMALEILQNIGSIEITNDKLSYIQAFDWEKFKQDELYESLNGEFEAIIEFKKELLNCEISHLSEIVEEVYSN